jgi:hypothetical protein
LTINQAFFWQSSNCDQVLLNNVDVGADSRIL